MRTNKCRIAPTGRREAGEWCTTTDYQQIKPTVSVMRLLKSPAARPIRMLMSHEKPSLKRA